MKWEEPDHPVESLWRKYFDAYKDDIPQPLIQPVRATFYCGAATMFYLMLEPLMDGGKPSGAAFNKWMDAIETDLKNFRAGLN